MVQVVLSEIEDGVRTITLNRPERLNAMNRELIDAVAGAFEAADADEATRAIIFTGAGRAFCAGDDLKDHRQPESEAEARGAIEAIQRCTRAIVFGHKPVVGAIHGWAVGGGFEWAINCDFPIWAEDARAFFPELELGVFVTGAVTSLLPAIVGLQRAREMMMLGETYEAARLQELGLAWRVVPREELMAEARELAARLAAKPERGLRDMKRILNEAAFASIERALELETEATVAGFLDPETTARIARFGETD